MTEGCEARMKSTPSMNMRGPLVLIVVGSGVVDVAVGADVLEVDEEDGGRGIRGVRALEVVDRGKVVAADVFVGVDVEDRVLKPVVTAS